MVVRLAVLFAFPTYFSFEATGVINGEGANNVYAQNLMQTGVFGLQAGVPDAFLSSMLYPYVLAAIYHFFGVQHLPVDLFQIALDVIALFCLIQIGNHLFDARYARWVGLLGGLFYALYPYLIFQNLTLIFTPLLMALMYAFVLCCILLREQPDWNRRTWFYSLLGGILLGLTVYTRPGISVLPIGVALWFLTKLSLGQTIKRLLPVALVSFAMLVPWAVRNYGIYGRLVFGSASLGFNLWSSYSPYTIPFIQAGYGTSFLPEIADLPTNKGIVAADAQLSAMGLDYLRQHISQLPQFLWVKLLAYWSIDVYPTHNPINGVVPFVREGDQIRALTDPQELKQAGYSIAGDVYAEPLFAQVGRTVHRIYFGILLALALIGIWLTIPQWRSVSLLWIIQICMTLVYILLVPETRYRVPTDPMLFLFSAYTLVWVASESKIMRRFNIASRSTNPNPAS